MPFRRRVSRPFSTGDDEQRGQDDEAGRQGHDDAQTCDETELGALSEPIRDDTVTTKSGYWLIKVLDEDNNRQLEEEDREILKDRAFNEWVTSLWDDPDNEVDDSYLDAARKAWAIQRLL